MHNINILIFIFQMNLIFINKDFPCQVQPANEEGWPGQDPRQYPHGGVQVQVPAHLGRNHRRGRHQVGRSGGHLVGRERN